MSTASDIHQNKVARETLRMSDEGVKIRGGMTKAEARKILCVPVPKERKWHGTWPAKCDFCRVDLKHYATFIDGRTKRGPWALMCPLCHEDDGIGLGPGYGQKYDSKTLKKVEG